VKIGPDEPENFHRLINRCHHSGTRYLDHHHKQNLSGPNHPLAFSAYPARRWIEMQAEWMSGPLCGQGKGHKVLLIPGLLNVRGMDGSGNYIGDTMQRADLAAGLVALGVKVEVYCGGHADTFLPDAPLADMPLNKYSVIFADYMGIGHTYRIYAQAGRTNEVSDAVCKICVIDAFGTEESYIRKRNRVPSRIVPQQIPFLHEAQILIFEDHHIQFMPGKSTIT